MSVAPVGRIGDEISGYTTGTVLGLGSARAFDTPVAVGVDEEEGVLYLLDGETTLWVGNSYTSNYDSAPEQVAYLVNEMAGISVTMGPPPHQ